MFYRKPASVLTRTLFAIASVATSLMAQDEASLTANDIIQRYAAGNRTKSEMAYIKMQVQAPSAAPVERRILLAYKEQDGKESMFMRLLMPKEVEGVTLLAATAADKTLSYHFFLPAFGKMKQLTPEARQGAFLGSDYTFEDLLREVPEWHSYEKMKDDTVGEATCYVIRAKENRAEKESAYAYRDLYIEKGNFHLRKVAYYNAKDSLVKMLTASGYDAKSVKGKTTRPQEAVMLSVETGSKTTFTVIEGRVDEGIDDEYFTPAKLENWPLLDVEEFIFDLGMTVDVN